MLARLCLATLIPELRAAEGALPPTFWELHGRGLWLAGLISLLLPGLFWWARGKVAATLPPPETVVSQRLRALEAVPENSVVAGIVLEALREHFPATLAWPPGQRTVDEMILRLQAEPRLTAELTDEIADLLRHCERRQFFSGRLGGEGRVVSRALVIIEKTAAATARSSQQLAIRP